MSYNLPYTNADVRPKPKIIDLLSFNMEHVFIPSFHYYVTHVGKCMRTSAKLLWGSIAMCMHGIIPRAFKYTALSTCLTIIEDDLQHNRVPANRPQSSRLNDVVIPFDEEEKME
jgi:hypothetical protein